MRDTVFVLGIDGATWRIIDKGIEWGLLPNFEEIKNRGVSSELKSTIPPFTLPAWTSLITGVNPGKHGIIDFFDVNGNLLNSTKRGAPTIFQILTECNISSISVNIPGTYPPDKIKGCVISDTLTTPSYKSDFVWPKIIKKLIIPYFKNSFNFEFIVAKLWSSKDINKLIDLANSIALKELNVHKKLQKIFSDAKLIWQVIRTTDILQHQLYDGSEEKLYSLLKHYKIIDDKIGELINHYNTLIIVSDHGFAPLKMCIYINRLLEKYSYFKTSFKTKFLYYLSPIVNLFMNFLPVNLLHKFIPLFKKSYNEKNITSNKVFLHSYTSQGIVVKDSRLLHTVFSKLKKDLSELGVINNLYLKEELFSGDMLDRIPDIIVETKEGYILSDMYSKHVLAPPPKLGWSKKADHTPNGIFVAYSQKYSFELTKKPNVLDIAPTIANMIGIRSQVEFEGQNILKVKL